ncbi:MAG: FtsW/RodA/SpoVE family cell cycle protein [candidate division WOR-3 bacterium]
MKPKIDLIYFQAIIFLLVIGILSIYSTTFYEKLFFPKELQTNCFTKTLKWVGIGLVILFLSVGIDFSVYYSKPKLFGIIRLPVTGSVFLWCFFFIGILYNVIRALFFKAGVERSFGGIFQPQEFFKYAHLFLLAHLVEKKVNDWWIVVFSLVGTFALLFQRAVGTAFIFFLFCTIFFFFVIRLKPFCSITYFLLVVFVIIIGIWKIPYAKERFGNFWNRKREKIDLAQIDWRKLTHQENARIAIASGGWFGRGLGRGLQKFGFLVLVHTDFIFANICEEMGFVGAIIILFLFFILFWRGLLIASAFHFGFEYMVAAGVSVILSLYLFIHILVGLDLIPCTGQPLPFISYGGAALISNLWAVGTVLNISHSQKR